MPTTPIRPTPSHTRRLLRPADGRADPDTTDYELSASTMLPPAMRLVPDEPADPAESMDPAARRLFQQRLRLCCVIAAVLFVLIFISALTELFGDLFGRKAVGWPVLGLSGSVLAGLIGTVATLTQMRTLSTNTLRVIEIALFGSMGLFFGYYQFAVLTSESLRAAPPRETVTIAGRDILIPSDEVRAAAVRAARMEQYAVVAAALVVHVNWAALIIFHGMLVPNTLARGVSTAVGMVLVAVIIDAVAVGIHEPTRRQAGIVFAMSMTLLAAAGLSVFGTAKTAALRQEVESARQAIRELGQYRLRRKLGQGGMGEVYLAEHQLLKRPCAVKRIHARYLNNADQIKRFEREVQTTARLRHPNTVEVYDFGRADDGTFYYVMEYLPGLSLEELVNRYGPMPADRVVHVLRQVCGALAEAHAAGLVHRDIKPSNVILLPAGSPYDQVKVVDFGLVQHLAADADPEAKITRDGLIVGTPEYMSPEQAQGMPLDQRSDLFSLGTVAYFLLTGKEAFHRDNPVRTLLAVVNEEAKPLTEWNPYAPADVAAVVAKCLVKPLDGRYAKAVAMEAALAACECHAGWTAGRAAEWWEQHPKANPGTDTDLNSLPVQLPVKGPKGA